MRSTKSLPKRLSRRILATSAWRLATKKSSGERCHGFDCAQAMEVGVGVGNDLGRKRIEERLPLGGPWQRLVQGAPRSRPEVSPRQHSTMPGLTSTRTEITLWSRLHAKEKRP